MYHITLQWIDSILSVFSTDKIQKGCLLCVLHYILYAYFVLYMCFGPINTTFYGILLTIGLTFVSHILFQGCILLKAERIYFDKEWKGLFHGLELLNIYPTDLLIQQQYSNYLILAYASIIIARFCKSS